jgi:uncharacterized protein (DUF433 family)
MSEFSQEKLSQITLREAAYVFGEDVKAITKIVDEHADLTSTVTVGKRKKRVFGPAEMIYMQALEEVGPLLSPIGRRELHEALVRSDVRREVKLRQFRLELGDLQKKVQQRLEALEQLKGGVEGNPEDPVIKGTNVAVYRISALLDGGATPEQVKQDYPRLSTEEIAGARDYARAIPKKGRPYPNTSFKRATRELNLHLLDELLAQEEAEGRGE